MAGFVRGFADMMEGGHSNRAVSVATQSQPNLNVCPVPFQAPAAPGFFNGNDQKLLGVTNTTNVKVKGDGNGALSLLNFK